MAEFSRQKSIEMAKLFKKYRHKDKTIQILAVEYTSKTLYFTFIFEGSVVRDSIDIGGKLPFPPYVGRMNYYIPDSEVNRAYNGIGQYAQYVEKIF